MKMDVSRRNAYGAHTKHRVRAAKLIGAVDATRRKAVESLLGRGISDVSSLITRFPDRTSLIAILTRCFQASTDLAPNIAIHGPRGCGKSTFVSASVQALSTFCPWTELSCGGVRSLQRLFEAILAAAADATVNCCKRVCDWSGAALVGDKVLHETAAANAASHRWHVLHGLISVLTLPSAMTSEIPSTGDIFAELSATGLADSNVITDGKGSRGHISGFDKLTALLRWLPPSAAGANGETMHVYCALMRAAMLGPTNARQKARVEGLAEAWRCAHIRGAGKGSVASAGGKHGEEGYIYSKARAGRTVSSGSLVAPAWGPRVRTLEDFLVDLAALTSFTVSEVADATCVSLLGVCIGSLPPQLAELLPVVRSEPMRELKPSQGSVPDGKRQEKDKGGEKKASTSGSDADAHGSNPAVAPPAKRARIADEEQTVAAAGGQLASNSRLASASLAEATQGSGPAALPLPRGPSAGASAGATAGSGSSLQAAAAAPPQRPLAWYERAESGSAALQARVQLEDASRLRLGLRLVLHDAEALLAFADTGPALVQLMRLPELTGRNISIIATTSAAPVLASATALLPKSPLLLHFPPPLPSRLRASLSQQPIPSAGVQDRELFTYFVGLVERSFGQWTGGRPQEMQYLIHALYPAYSLAVARGQVRKEDARGLFKRCKLHFARARRSLLQREGTPLLRPVLLQRAAAAGPNVTADSFSSFAAEAFARIARAAASAAAAVGGSGAGSAAAAAAAASRMRFVGDGVSVCHSAGDSAAAVGAVAGTGAIVAWEATSTRRSVELGFSHCSKALLLASFFASHNPASTDRRYFSVAQTGKARVLGRAARDALARAKERQLLSGPRPAPLQRILAIYYSLLAAAVAEGLPVEPTTGRYITAYGDLLVQLGTMVALGLIIQHSAPTDGFAARYSCRLRVETAAALADNVGIAFAKFIHDPSV